MELTEIVVIAAFGAAIWFWLDSLKAREAGVRAARQACAEEGLQFLDETVVGRSLRPARNDAGHFRLRRVYAFEFSDTGNNRCSGSVTLLGGDVEFLHIRPQLYVVPKAPEQHETIH